MFARLLSGFTAVKLSDALLVTILPITVFSMSIGVAEKGVILALESGFWVAGLVLGSRLSDSFSLKFLVFGSLLIRAAALAFFSLASTSSSTPLFIVVAVALGTATGLSDTPLTIWLAHVARISQIGLTVANSWRSGLANSATVLGPLLASVLIGSSLVVLLIFTSGALLLAAALVFSRVRSRKLPSRSGANAQSIVPYLFANRWLMLLLGQGAALLLLVRAPAKVIALATLTNAGYGELYGVIVAVQAGAAILGAFSIARLPAHSSARLLTGTQLLLITPLLALVPTWNIGLGPALLIAGFGLAGLGLGAYGVVLNATLQSEVKAGLLGRVYAVQGLVVWGADPIALAFGGFVVSLSALSGIATLLICVGAPFAMSALLSSKLRKAKV